MSLIKCTLTALCLVALLAAPEIGANPLAERKQQDKEPGTEVANDQLPIGPDGSLFLTGDGCKGDDEYLAAGALPSCEPTCRDPRPMCSKVFFVSLDYVPCFCKKPLVRNEKTRQCVEVSECTK